MSTTPSTPHRPFLKWAGGKARLAPRILDLLPEEIETYYEPFLGGGAVFFELAARKRFRRAVISDANPELINAYRMVRDSPTALIARLKAMRASKEAYLEVRDSVPEDSVDRAARTIYLNRTGFNGLYRVNRAGKFNVPFGRYERPAICQEEKIGWASRVLQEVGIECADFEDTIRDARPGDAVYFDPPYLPASPTANFTAYTAAGFDRAAHERLAKAFGDLKGRGVAVVLSNADTASARHLFEGHAIAEVRMPRAINSRPTARGKVGELLVY